MYCPQTTSVNLFWKFLFIPTPFVLEQINQIYKRNVSFRKKLALNGISEHMHLLDTDGNYLTYDLLMNKFGINKCDKDFTLFIKLIAKLPEIWNDKENSRISQTPQNQLIYEEFKTTLETFNGIKAIYQFVQRQVSKDFTDKQCVRWENELNVDNIPWSIFRTLTVNSTPETKLKAFQIKLNSRAIVTNIALGNFSLVESENCTFCNQHIEKLLCIHFAIVHVSELFGRIYKTGFPASSRPISILRKPICCLVLI